MNRSDDLPEFSAPETLLTHGGRDPAAQWGFVNTPVVRGSTVVFETLDALEDAGRRYRYGRQGTPTTQAVADIVTALEEAEGTVLTPSGLAAISMALLSCLKAGDEVLMSDSVYEPTRNLCTEVLAPLGVSARFYDPRMAGGVATEIGERTRVVYVESPGSLTFEVQDLPAIAAAAHARGCLVVADNTWATPLYHRPLALGADLVIHAGTKMFVGHSDAMLGTVSARGEAWAALREKHFRLGMAVGPDDAFLTARGLRTLAVRMEAHRARALALAEWLAGQAGVREVLHPALPDHPDQPVFARDFTGSGSLFGFVLDPAPRAAVAAMVDGMRLFAMGYSWGGYESLLLPVDPRGKRTAVPWTREGNLFRVHAGFEALDDLKADLAAGMARYRAAM